MVHQLTRNLSEAEIKASGFDTYFVDHTTGVYPIAASGVPWTASYIGVKGDTITDLHEDMGAEQKARTTYDNLIRLIDDPDVLDDLLIFKNSSDAEYKESMRRIVDIIENS
jgi:spore coat protein JC